MSQTEPADWDAGPLRTPDPDSDEDDFARAVRPGVRAGGFDDDVESPPANVESSRAAPVPPAYSATVEADRAEPRLDSGETRRIDPYASSEPRGGSEPPTVDVSRTEPEAENETDAEREARIEEMERALDNFGRRRIPDYGRRGRRR